MSVEFKTISEPSAEIINLVSALAPENPFYTPEYVNVMLEKGSASIVLLLESEGQLVTACTAFSKKGRINQRLDIISLPAIRDQDVFWNGLDNFCRDSDISILGIYTFGSNDAFIRKLGGEVFRKSRYEYQLDLSVCDIWNGLQRRHQRHIKTARKKGLEFRPASEDDAYTLHADLANLSLNRRKSSGDNIAYSIDVRDLISFRNNNAGELYQAVFNGEVVSSIFVLKSPTGAYAQTSGTSNEGRDCGASQFLFFEVACLLKSEGKVLFNLGGTDIDSTGLQEFKASFGAKRVELEAAEFYFGGAFKKAVGKTVDILRSLR